jgi:hypothetical protein
MKLYILHLIEDGEINWTVGVFNNKKKLDKAIQEIADDMGHSLAKNIDYEIVETEMNYNLCLDK